VKVSAHNQLTSDLLRTKADEVMQILFTAIGVDDLSLAFQVPRQDVAGGQRANVGGV
jgi:hypothetical protein